MMRPPSSLCSIVRGTRRTRVALRTFALVAPGDTGSSSFATPSRF